MDKYLQVRQQDPYPTENLQEITNKIRNQIVKPDPSSSQK